MVALIAGLVLLVLGILGLVFWFGLFWDVLRGSVPFIFTICGLAAIAVGISSVKDKAAAATKEVPEQPKPAPEESKPEGDAPSS